MLTTEQIAAVKNRMVYSLGRYDVLHPHDDCVRIAYAWLDAQVKTKGLRKMGYPWKHIIEKWGGRYVSRSDVELAAEIHPDIIGVYPNFNIGRRLVLPSDQRLAGIGTARKCASTPDIRLELSIGGPAYWWTELEDGKFERATLPASPRFGPRNL